MTQPDLFFQKMGLTMGRGWGAAWGCWSVVPFYYDDFAPWVGLDDWLVKVSWLGKLVSVFWCMEMDFFSQIGRAHV